MNPFSRRATPTAPGIRDHGARTEYTNDTAFSHSRRATAPGMPNPYRRQVKSNRSKSARFGVADGLTG